MSYTQTPVGALFAVALTFWLLYLSMHPGNSIFLIKAALLGVRRSLRRLHSPR